METKQTEIIKVAAEVEGNRVALAYLEAVEEDYSERDLSDEYFDDDDYFPVREFDDDWFDDDDDDDSDDEADDDTP